MASAYGGNGSCVMSLHLTHFYNKQGLFNISGDVYNNVSSVQLHEGPVRIQKVISTAQVRGVSIIDVSVYS